MLELFRTEDGALLGTASACGKTQSELEDGLETAGATLLKTFRRER